MKTRSRQKDTNCRSGPSIDMQRSARRVYWSGQRHPGCQRPAAGWVSVNRPPKPSQSFVRALPDRGGQKPSRQSKAPANQFGGGSRGGGSRFSPVMSPNPEVSESVPWKSVLLSVSLTLDESQPLAGLLSYGIPLSGRLG